MLRYTSDQYSSTFITTIGIDYKKQTLAYKGQKIGMQIWDTAGQERFRSITGSYIRGAQGIMLVYDVTDENTFNNVHVWLHTIKQQESNEMVKLLVGNKCDLESARVVSVESGREIAKKFGMSFMEASAKEGTNVRTAYETIAHKIVDSIVENESKRAKESGNSKVDLSKGAAGGGTKKGGCC